LDPETSPARIIRSLPGLSRLLTSLGWPDPDAWIERWHDNRGPDVLQQAWWSHPVSTEWVWGVALPLLTALERSSGSRRRQLIGLSGLPGCGKSTLASWLAQASVALSLPVAVVSLDDFYWPGTDLDKAMAGNPWGVPRALPGSHDLDLLRGALDRWRTTGQLRVPRFEKSLRDGRGDRCGWSDQVADVCLLEGWFVGVLAGGSTDADATLRSSEQTYRQTVTKQLELYGDIWRQLDRLWHLRAPALSASRLWKEQQEHAMHQRCGVRLSPEDLEGFVRMIETAIPERSLQNLPGAEVVIHLTASRRIREVSAGGDQASSSASSATG